MSGDSGQSLKPVHVKSVLDACFNREGANVPDELCIVKWQVEFQSVQVDVFKVSMQVAAIAVQK
jgi:hypothetical protein